MARFFVYLLASGRNGTLYVGVTNDLRRRVTEHRAGQSEFTRKYRVHRLVWFEMHESLVYAQQRERNIKHWRRRWKLDLIERANPGWCDLAGEIPLS